jgi:tRNA dimethylallyltransferase
VASKHEKPQQLPPAVLLMGPTAAGKTAIALALARRLPVGLISVDSAQVYRGLDIGAAKPDAETLRECPHELIDLREPEESYSVADFMSDADSAIKRVAASGRLPLLVGGTMMYFKALVYGLDRMPAADPALRAVLAKEAAERGWVALHAELATHDPIAAAVIRPSDPQRIQRALEVLRLSGKGPSHWQSHNRIPRLSSLRLVVTPSDRHILHHRIALRLEQMLSQGFMQEVEALRTRPGLGPDSASMRSVGYRQAWQHLDGACDQAGFLELAGAATRQLAKRQLTALRQFPDSLWYDPDRSLTIEMIFRQVEDFSKLCGKPGGNADQATPDGVRSTH